MTEAPSALLAPTQDECAEQVGQFTMTLRHAQASAEFETRWSRRAEPLAAWLMLEWHREHQENN